MAFMLTDRVQGAEPPVMNEDQGLHERIQPTQAHGIHLAAFTGAERAGNVLAAPFSTMLESFLKPWEIPDN